MARSQPSYFSRALPSTSTVAIEVNFSLAWCFYLFIVASRVVMLLAFASYRCFDSERKQKAATAFIKRHSRSRLAASKGHLSLPCYVRRRPPRRRQPICLHARLNCPVCPSELSQLAYLMASTMHFFKR